MIFIMSTIIVGIVVLACLGIAAKHIYKLFHGETSCCGTEQPKVPEKKLNGPIVGEKVVEISGMTCGNCKRTASKCCSMTSTARPRKSISIATRQR